MVTKIELNNINNAEKGYLIGLFVGDGYLYHDRWGHYKINFYLNPKKDRDIAKFTINLLNKIGLSPYIMHHKGCLIIRINSKKLFLYIQKKADKIFLEKKDFLIGFTSGLIDSDGYVAKGDIVISNIDKHLLEKIHNFCIELGIYSKIWEQKITCRCNDSIIWRLRISTNFKYEKHHSRKILRVYGGGNSPTAHHSEYLSERINAYKGGVVRKSRRAHNP